MNKFFLLIKNYINIYIGNIKRSAARNKKSVLSGQAILLIAGLVFVLMFTSMSLTIIEEAIKIGDASIAITANISVGIIFMFLMIVMKGTSTKKGNDFELLLSLPIPKRTIVLAKIIKNILFDFLSLLLIMFPGFICYYLLVDEANILIPIRGFVLILLLPLFAQAITIFLQQLIFKLTYKLKRADLFQSFFNIFIMILFFLFYIYVNTKLSDFDSGFTDKFYSFYPFQVMSSFILNGELQYLFIIALFVLIPFCIATGVQIKSFTKKNIQVKRKEEVVTYKGKKILTSLFHKELSRYFRSPLYVMNTIAGAIFVLITSLLIFFIGTNYIADLLSLYIPLDFSKLLPALIVMIMTVLSSTIMTTQSSISIEGKQLWIIKSLPVHAKTVFQSKIMMNLVLGIPFILVSSILLSIKIGIIYLPFLIILPTLAMFFSSIHGLNLNLIYPKFDWEAEEEIIKRGMAVFISLTTTIIPFFISFIIVFILGNQFSPYIVLTIITICIGLIDFSYYHILMRHADKRLEKL